MKFWKRHSVCAVCGAHFEPVTGYEARWGHLCSMHRKEVRERDEKKEPVISWATANWERLAPMMEKECAEQKNAFDQAMPFCDSVGFWGGRALPILGKADAHANR